MQAAGNLNRFGRGWSGAMNVERDMFHLKQRARGRPPSAGSGRIAVLLGMLLTVVIAAAAVRELGLRTRLASLEAELATQVAGAARDASICRAEIAAVRALGPPTTIEAAGWERPAVLPTSSAGAVASRILNREAVGIDACARSFEAEALIREIAQ